MERLSGSDNRQADQMGNLTGCEPGGLPKLRVPKAWSSSIPAAAPFGKCMALMN